MGNARPVVLVDVKNCVLHGAGITHWLETLFAELKTGQSLIDFVFVAPNVANPKNISFGSREIVKLSWLNRMPGVVQNLVYDNFTFPRFARKIKPALVFSPYFDLRIPRGTRSIITIHDLCYLKLPNIYPQLTRKYFVHAMKRSINRAEFVVTVSNSVAREIAEMFLSTVGRIQTFGNSIPDEFRNYTPSDSEILAFRDGFGAAGTQLILYTGGLERRKNIDTLFRALVLVHQAGIPFNLVITGERNSLWNKYLTRYPNISESIAFTGRLRLPDLKVAYAASDKVVYPSLCEGFGRVVGESMFVGTPIVCSDLDVFREVAGKYPHYFDPSSVTELAELLGQSPLPPHDIDIKAPNLTDAEISHNFLRFIEEVVGK